FCTARRVIYQAESTDFFLALACPRVDSLRWLLHRLDANDRVAAARHHRHWGDRRGKIMRQLLVMSVALGCWFAATAAAAEPGRPNVVVILSDDMGFSDLGCYGGEIATPNLDALAAGGVCFTQFYNNARCCPTRASLLTGLYPHRAGVGHMM